VQAIKSPWYFENQLKHDDKRTAEEKFKACHSKVLCNKVMNGRFYYCDFLAQSEMLRAIPYNKNNCLDLKEASKEKIKSYLTSNVYPPGCKYCSGHDRDLQEIPRAIQVREPLPYKSFAETYPEGY
jgi:hypothetical protein